MPTLREGVDTFDFGGSGGEGDSRDVVDWEAFFLPPRVPILADFFSLACVDNPLESESESETDPVAPDVPDVRRFFDGHEPVPPRRPSLDD